MGMIRAFKSRGERIDMLGSDTEDALFLLISTLSLISSVVNFIILFIFLRIREEQRIHKLFLLQNASLLAFSAGLLGFINTIEIFEAGQIESSHRILALGFLTVCSMGLLSASIDWFHVAACYSGKEELARGQKRNVSHIPIGMVIVALWACFLIDRSSNLGPIHAAYNLTAILSTAVGGLFLLLASLLYIQTAFKSRQKHAIGMTLISILPVMGGLVSLSSLLINLEFGSSLIFVIQSITFLISNALLSLGLFRTGHLKLLPAAIQKIFYNLNDVVLVLDQNARITYFNSLAHEIFPNIHTGIAIDEQGYQLGPKLDQFRKDASISTNFQLNIKGLIYRVRILPIESKERTIGWIITLTDITKRKHVEEQLNHNALHDQLTDLPNRVLLIDRLNHALLSAQRDENYKYAVLFMDLDRFKFINESLGRQVGDQVIIEVGNRLKKCLRKVDTVARMEGDEFVILLNKISGVRAATEIAIRILEMVSQPIKINEQEISISISIGIAMGSLRHKEPEDILRDADIALHQSKDRGRSQYVIFDKEMHAHISTLFQLETDLLHALQDNQFELFYQPILSLPDLEILGFEALIRWKHPEHGLMMPGEFLHEADESELILPIGYWGIEQACQDLSQWSSKYSFNSPLSVSINLFRRQLLDPNLPGLLQSILHKTTLLPARLGFEIKERVIVDDDPQILNAIKELKSTKIKLIIDDFGSGYSSLRVLLTYPIDMIKIDPSYIRNISRSTEDYKVMRFIVELGQKLGVGVIAKGIEFPHELVEIQSTKCNQGQGSYFSEPLDRVAVVHLLDKITQMRTVNHKIERKRLF
jgi:diguanylate cyclase (GGDEF)-like protein